MRVGDDLPVGEHRRGRHAGLLQQCGRALVVELLAPGCDRRVDLVVRSAARGEVGPTLGQLWAPDCTGQRAPLRVVLDAKREPAVIARRGVGALRRDARRAVATRFGDAAREPVVENRLDEEGGAALQQ